MSIRICLIPLVIGCSSGTKPPRYLDRDDDGYIAIADGGEDCDDSNPTVHPGVEVDTCDQVDNDCDTLIDEDAELRTWYQDLDGDGYGSETSELIEACSQPEHAARKALDCDDTNPEPCRVVELSCGDVHSCALLDSGGMRCWGRGTSGALGYGNADTIDNPATIGDVPLGDEVVLISSGGQHTCAALSSGALYCWGRGGDGRLGLGHRAGKVGDDETVLDNALVDLGGEPVWVEAGLTHTCVILVGGAVRCWGEGTFGQLGYGNRRSIGVHETPAEVGDVDLGGVAVGLALGWRHSCALLDNGAVRCWGDGSQGQLGRGSTERIGDNESPASGGDVPLGGDAVQITAGSRHTCALLDSGGVRCWGSGVYGLGYGDTQSIGDDEVPSSVGDVPLGAIAVQIAASGVYTCALLDTGGVRCWGYQNAEMPVLGTGDDLVYGDDEPASAAPLVDLGEPAVGIAAGATHACAILQSGAVRCWGANDDGMLGYATDDEPVGVAVSPAELGDVPVSFPLTTR